MAGSSSAFGEEDTAILSDINVVPLVDVVLVLLIVFMLTVPAIIGSAPIKIDLPETTSAAMAAPTEDLPLHLFLKREESGRATLYLNNQPTTEASIRSLLNGYVATKEKPDTFLAADKELPYREIVKVIDMLGSLGLHKITLDTKHVAKE